MKKTYQRRPGVCLLEICGEYLLVAQRSVEGDCPYVSQINESAAFFWRTLDREMDLQQLIQAASREKQTKPEALLLPALAFLGKMEKKGYLIGKQQIQEPCTQDNNAK